MAGGSAVTSRSAILIVPALAVSSPAISRNVVDLPQPEGPSSATRWPAGAEKLTLSTAAAAPQVLVIPVEMNVRHRLICPLPARHCA